MSPLLALGLLVAGFCPAVLCLPPGTQGPGTVTQEAHKDAMAADNLRFASSNADFAFSLYKQLASMNPKDNVVFSPLSISTALAFLALGARNTTLTEILQGLKFNLTQTAEVDIHQGFQHLLRTLGRPSDQLQLSVGNAMFVQDNMELLTKFTSDAQGLYEAQTFVTNFQDPEAAETHINDYVKEKTQGKIVDLMKGLDSQTIMVLVNYIYFKGECQPGLGGNGLQVLTFLPWLGEPATTREGVSWFGGRGR